MTKEQYQILLKYLKESFFTPFITPCIAIIAIIIILLKSRNSRIGKLFVLYLSFYVINIFTYALFPFFKYYRKYITKDLEPFVDLFFTIFEFFIFYIFFRRIALTRINQIVLIIIKYIFISIVFCLVVNSVFWHHFLKLNVLQSIFTIQAVCLLIPCIFYYFKIFQHSPTLKLTNQADFWIVTGLAFFTICTMPFSLFINYISFKNPHLYHYLYSIFYIFYALLFIMIIRAFLCNPVTVK
jgi:hypothetical protein